MKTALCIVNARARGASQATARMSAALQARDTRFDIAVSRSVEESRRYAADAVAAGIDTVIAAGGDGTVHHIVQELVHTDTALGILPIGTGNDIARALGIRGLGSEYDQPPTLIDVACIEPMHRWFLAVLATGFDARVNATANALGPMRYLRGLVRELPRLSSARYDIEVDGRPRTESALMVAFGNLGVYGGGMRICPQASVDDGILDITWVHPVGRLRLLRLFPRVFRGTHIQLAEVDTDRGSVVVLRSPTSTIFADGEPVGSPPCTIRSIRGALRIHLPYQATA